MSLPRPDDQRAGHNPLPPVPRMVSQVPLPPYAQPTQTPGTAGSKLMSLNSTIMAAQREWEEKNQAGGPSSDESAYSESEGSSESDDGSSPQPIEVLASTGSSRGHTAGEKRSVGSANLEVSSRPAKRPLLMPSRESSGSPASSLRAGQPGATSQAQRNIHNGTNDSRRGESEWLLFDAWDTIDSRADGMSYDYYHVGHYKMKTMNGALVPTNYRLKKSTPCPFVCPDRGCGKAFDNARALGGHFSSSHKGNAYNDNCDGTLSKVGFYNRIAGKSWRAIVVSRVSVTGSEEESPYVACLGPYTAAHVSRTTPDPFTYVTQFLARHVDYTRFLTSAYIRELCELPRRHQLPAPWIKFHSNKDLSERMFALALAYITGREVFGLDICFDGLHQDGNRLSSHTIAVPFELSSPHKELYFPEDSCLGCYYLAEVHGNKSPRCSWSSSDRKPELYRYERRVDGLSDSDDDDGDFTYPGTEAMVAKGRRWARGVESAIQAGKAARFKMPSPNSLLRASQPPSQGQTPVGDARRATGSGTPSLASVNKHRAEQPSSTDAYGQGRIRTEPASTPIAESRPRHAPIAPAGRSSRAATTSSRMPVVSISPEALVQPGPSTQPPSTQAGHPVQAPASQLEMESWEIAPGRMVDATHGENIGYSNAYLNGREPVEVSQDVAFNVLTIKPGDKARWEADESQLRMCSVALGKIEIKIGAKKFGMGPNSVFIIRPGEKCVVTNKLYVDATIHCTTVKNYSLLS